MLYNEDMKVKRLLLLIGICILITFLLLAMSFLFLFSDKDYEIKFRKEINKNDRIEKLLFINSDYPRPDDDAFIIGIELKNGKHIIGEVENSIYNFNEIMKIGNYKIYTVTLNFNGYNSQWNSYYSEGIQTSNILKMLDNQTVSSEKKLNQILDYYNEIIEFLNKVYEEGPIPLGIEEGRDVDLSEWGEEDELQRYTGYISGYNLWNDVLKMKIYVEYFE